MRGEYWRTLRHGVLLIFIVVVFTIFNRVNLSLAVAVGIVLIYGCKILTDYQERKKVKL
jgi:hypothetical protein